MRFAINSLAWPLTLCALVLGTASVLSASTLAPIELNETRFDHSVTQNGLLEYFPQGSDSAAWIERLIVGRSTLAEPTLAETVEAVKAGMTRERVRIIRDYPVTLADGSKEYFLVAVANGDKYLELTARRFIPLESDVVELIYARREYGSGVGPTLSRWMQENGEQLEAQLLNLALDDVKAYMAEQ